MQLNLSSSKWLKILPFALLLAIVFPKFVGHGMFVDGVLYATISRNLALGQGSLWSPHYTETVFPAFYEHPPFAFLFQSLAFKIFPDFRAVEQLFTFVMGILHLFLIAKLWQLVKQPTRLGAWLASILFVMIPITFWTITNNELENQLLVFTMLSAIFSIKGLRNPKIVTSILYSIISFICIVLAFFIKGVFGLYPLVFPLFLFLFMSPKSKINFWISQLVFFIGTVATSVLIYFYQPSRNLFYFYFRDQVLSSLAGKRSSGSVPNLPVLVNFATDLAVPFGFCCVFYLVVLFQSKKTPVVNAKLENSSSSKSKLLFLCMALSASLPLLISPKNHRWYMMVSMPFFALFIADIFEKTFIQFSQMCASKTFLNKIPFYLCMLAFAVTTGLSARNWNRVLKNQVYYDDFGTESLAPLRDKTIGMCADDAKDWAINKDWEKWTVIANLARDYNISVADVSNPKYMLYMTNTSCEIPSHCSPIYPSQPKRYILYQCFQR